MSTTVLLAPPNSPNGGGGGGYSNTLSGSWVQDSAGNVYWLETATDEQGVVTYIYYDQPGGNIVTPTGDVSPVLDSNMQLVKRGDDINGDGSVVVTFYRLNIYDENGAILVSIPQSPDGTTYTVQGVEIDPQDEVEELLKQGNISTASITQNSSELNARTAGSFINFNFNECELTYVSSGAATGEIETAVYKIAGVVVGTITLSYDNATGDLTNVTRA